jgi:cytochrome P450
MLRLSALDMAVAAAALRLTESRLLARVHPVLRARREACALLAAEIEAVRAEGGAEGRGDVLAMLAQEPELGVEELCDQLVTLLLAGHETTTTGLAWCCERLMREPQAMVRLRDSLDRGEEDYLDAVIAETLRLRPVVDAVWRRLAAPARIAGYDLPAGTIVMPSIVLDQLSPELGDPETFRPERFLGGSLPPHTNIPFGGGTRRCVGASFALMEMRVVLRALFERLELAPVSQRAERARFHHVTLVPARGARAVASLRPAALRR